MYTTYPQNNNYAPQYNGYQGYAPMPQQPIAAPVAPSSSANMGLLVVAGLAVVGAAAFGGVYLMNSSHEAQPTAASAPSTVVNLPSTIEIPSLTPNSDPASPVIVNNPAPVRVFTPSAPRSNNAPAPAPVVAQAPVSAPTGPVADPTKTDPAKTDPAKTDPAKTDPAKTDPAKTDPAKTDPAKTDPAKTGSDTPKTGSDTPKTENGQKLPPLENAPLLG